MSASHAFISRRDVINGFLTDKKGRGEFNVTLDFLLSDGIYPFDQYDVTPLGFPDPLLPAEIKRVADNAGGRLRVISHLAEKENPDLGLRRSRARVRFRAPVTRSATTCGLKGVTYWPVTRIFTDGPLSATMTRYVLPSTVS